MGRGGGGRMPAECKGFCVHTQLRSQICRYFCQQSDPQLTSPITASSTARLLLHLFLPFASSRTLTHASAAHCPLLLVFDAPPMPAHSCRCLPAAGVNHEQACLQVRLCIWWGFVLRQHLIDGLQKSHGGCLKITEKQNTQAVKTLPTSIKGRRIPRAEAPCIPFTKRNKVNKSMGNRRVTGSARCCKHPAQ
eukprot:1158810-Pelagomonas_calceolata.AAC.6